MLLVPFPKLWLTECFWDAFRNQLKQNQSFPPASRSFGWAVICCLRAGPTSSRLNSQCQPKVTPWHATNIQVIVFSKRPASLPDQSGLSVMEMNVQKVGFSPQVIQWDWQRAQRVQTNNTIQSQIGLLVPFPHLPRAILEKFHWNLNHFWGSEDNLNFHI